MARPDSVYASELLKREVLDLDSGESAGTAVDLAVSRDGCVVQVGILPHQWYQGGLGVAPAAIASLSHDRLCLTGGASLQPFAEALEAGSALVFAQLQGKLVVEREGVLLGALADFAFRLEDGRISDLVVQEGLEGKRVRVSVEQIRAVGRDYMVIDRGPIQSPPAPAEAPTAAVAQPLAEPVLLPPAEALSTAASARAPATTSPTVSEASAPEPEPAAPAPDPLVDELPEIDADPPSAEDAQEQYDERRRQFLLGKAAHRELRSPDGALILAKGKTLTDKAVNDLKQHGLLDRVFIEMTHQR